MKGKKLRTGLTFDDVLLVPKQGVLESRRDADISSELVSGLKLNVPIVAANMPSVVATDMANAIYIAGGYAIFPRFGQYESLERLKTSLDFGLNKPAGVSFGYRDWSRVEAAHELGCRVFCLDVAHGDHKLTLAHIKEFNTQYYDCKLIVGNVARAAAAYDLAKAGADAVKIGIGPGAACRTREVTGFGVPQLTAIMDCVTVKEFFPDLKLIADGGIRNSGDIVKALAAGADTVMIGSLLAGCDEAPNPGEYYGNASAHVNGHRAPEGIHGRVERKGSVEDVIKELAWGIKSGLSYGGATNLEELRRNAEFIQVTAAGQMESRTRLQDPDYMEVYTDQIEGTILKVEV